MTDLQVIEDAPHPTSPNHPDNATNPFETWPAVLQWPPSRAFYEALQLETHYQAIRERGPYKHEPGMRFCGRPLFVIDGIALNLIVELTGHLDQILKPNNDFTGHARVADGSRPAVEV